ncbi:hypothetical protein NA57DRAFT_55227 [Rhizodiscina lignyota]|uniref:C2H2-type domain-containing protein n=1 Tax=Rhizodiscina lignyota TaxID=1504668 RepID=A0A9P4M6U0_9PEZI|nr:hypothetical protein NA57DRAFT_55227 [Rhizodiscina lignyota]
MDIGAWSSNQSVAPSPLTRPSDVASGCSQQVVSTSDKDSSKRFQCDLCPNSFTRKENLVGHVRAAHSNERPFACKECGKRFVRKNDRDRHEKQHSAPKQFRCGGRQPSGQSLGCGRAFHRLDALKSHLRSKLGKDCAKSLTRIDKEETESPSTAPEETQSLNIQDTKETVPNPHDEESRFAEVGEVSYARREAHYKLDRDALRRENKRLKANSFDCEEFYLELQSRRRRNALPELKWLEIPRIRPKCIPLLLIQRVITLEKELIHRGIDVEKELSSWNVRCEKIPIQATIGGHVSSPPPSPSNVGADYGVQPLANEHHQKGNTELSSSRFCRDGGSGNSCILRPLKRPRNESSDIKSRNSAPRPTHSPRDRHHQIPSYALTPSDVFLSLSAEVLNQLPVL